jgi:predicted nuclease with TOPRIM domain
MPPAVTPSKSAGSKGFSPPLKAAKNALFKGARLQSKKLTKNQQKRAKAAEAAAREQASQDAAASTHKRLAAELATLQAKAERLTKDTDKVTKRAKYLETQLESERQMFRREAR